MRIGLIGCEFESPNKGCEALTYSFIHVLQECIDDKDLVIYNFSGTGLGNIDKEFPLIKFINVEPKIKDIRFNYIKKIKECDIIFDATMGDSFSDIYSYKYYNSLIKHKKIIQFFSKKYILLPQTYGPFLKDTSLKKAKKILKRSYKIYCRDNLSKKLLEEKLKIKNSILVTDMAFFLPFDKKRYKLKENRIKIGINISGLLYRGGFESENQFNLTLNYKKFINDLILYLISEGKYDIYIIPHVIDIKENAHDDDYIISKQIQDKYKECHLAPIFKSPIDAKSFISNMNIFIGSRMHSTIAAFSSNVITIPISYSRKFEGLFSNFNYNSVINGRMCNEEDALQEIKKYLFNSSELKFQQNESLKLIERQKKNFLDNIKNDLKSK